MYALFSVSYVHVYVCIDIKTMLLTGIAEFHMGCAFGTKAGQFYMKIGSTHFIMVTTIVTIPNMD